MHVGTLLEEVGRQGEAEKQLRQARQLRQGLMPYVMGLYPPNECIYTLGYYRPGNCAPYAIDPLPLSIRAALLEGGVWTGMVFLIP